MNQEERNDIARLLEQLAQRLRRNEEQITAEDATAARFIAADESRQTGRNLDRFLDGRNDHAYGVRCVRAGMMYMKEKQR